MENSLLCKLAEVSFIAKGTASYKSAMVLLWVCGGSFHTFLNALHHATHKYLTADPYRNLRGAP